jgi:hypothetical protein
MSHLSTGWLTATALQIRNPRFLRLFNVSNDWLERFGVADFVVLDLVCDFTHRPVFNG